MYGPIWPFLLMCVSCDMRCRDFLRFDEWSHLGIKLKVKDYLGSSVGVSISLVLIPASQLGIRA